MKYIDENMPGMGCTKLPDRQVMIIAILCVLNQFKQKKELMMMIIMICKKNTKTIKNIYFMSKKCLMFDNFIQNMSLFYNK